MRHKLKDINYLSRKLHIHLGLFLLLFIWLFALSGLLLNQGNKWKFASFWEQRKENISVIHLRGISNLDSSALLKSIMNQLKISGEVSDVKIYSDSLDFRVSIPGHERNLHVNIKNGTCVNKEMSFNVWGKMRVLHTFKGFNTNDPELPPNWIVTRIWQFTKDVIAIGLIILSFTSWIMWFKIRKSYRWGLVFLLSGFAISIFFVFH